MTKKEFKENLAYLEENGIRFTGATPWPEEHPMSVELENYTDAGGDMIIYLEEPTKERLQSYINDFDINEEIMIWWRDGEGKAHAAGVPFDNIGQHYDDLKAWLKDLQEVCDGMPH